MWKYIFLLGREPEVSISELRSLFGSVKHEGQFAKIESDIEKIQNISKCLGWTIKIAEITAENLSQSEVVKVACEEVRKLTDEERKIRIGIDSFAAGMSNLVFKVKDVLKKEWRSIRVIQHDNWRVKTATTIHEKLLEKGIEFMLLPDKQGFILGRTVWIQDIESYTKRDMERVRSMTVGMMPPKLAQVMINLATRGDGGLAIWDPFCGLGTTLIEAKNGGFSHLLGSDISSEMVEATKTNTLWEIFLFDARKIDAKKLESETVIVTEGLLGRNFTPQSITHTLALKERSELAHLYHDFLSSAYRNPQITRVVCSLPFWNIGREKIYLADVSLFSSWKIDPLSRSWSRYLVHMRPDQVVGREIVVLQRG